MKLIQLFEVENKIVRSGSGDFLEFSGNGKTFVVVKNNNLRGNSKWICYDKHDSSAVFDPASKAEAIRLAKDAIRNSSR